MSEGPTLAIKAIKSQYFVCMSKGGNLQAKKNYSKNCDFKESFLENNYNAYSSAKWTKIEMFITLSQKGRPMKGKRTKKELPSSHFIPMKCWDEERRVE